MNKMAGVKKAYAIVIIVTTKENAVKMTFDKKFWNAFGFWLFKKFFISLRTSERFDRKPWINIQDAIATYKLSEISLVCNAMFDEYYVTVTSELYNGTASISFTKVTSIHYQILSKKDTTWETDIKMMFVY